MSSPALKQQIREAAEAEERLLYEGRGGERWLRDLEKLRTGAVSPSWKPRPGSLQSLPSRRAPMSRGPRKNYYVKESVGLATGFLIQALHSAGLATLPTNP